MLEFRRFLGLFPTFRWTWKAAYCHLLETCGNASPMGTSRRFQFLPVGTPTAVPKRRLARTIAFQILYSIVYNPIDVDEAARRYSFLEPERKKTLPPFAVQLASLVRSHQEELDSFVDAVLEHWTPERLTLPDRILLRLACAEFFYCDDIPPKVTFDEYIELARRFGDDKSPAFVNGVLDAVLKHHALPEGKRTE